MTQEQRDDVINQIRLLLDTGVCDLPLEFDDVARRVARHPNYPRALQTMMEGKSLLLKLITEACAASLVREFIPDETPE